MATSLTENRKFFTITPSDVANLTTTARRLWVGVTGDIKVTGNSGGTVIFIGVPVGWLDIEVRKVWSTDTTATNILGVA